MEKKILQQFLNKIVKVTYQDTNEDRFAKGQLINLTDEVLVILYHAGSHVIALDRIKSIREVSP